MKNTIKKKKKKVVLRGFLNCTGIKKLKVSVPQATRLCLVTVTAGSTVAPLNDTMQLSFTLQPIPCPPKHRLTQDQPNLGLLDLPILPQMKVWLLLLR